MPVSSPISANSRDREHHEAEHDREPRHHQQAQALEREAREVAERDHDRDQREPEVQSGKSRSASAISTGMKVP